MMVLLSDDKNTFGAFYKKRFFLFKKTGGAQI